MLQASDTNFRLIDIEKNSDNKRFLKNLLDKSQQQPAHTLAQLVQQSADPMQALAKYFESPRVCSSEETCDAVILGF